MSLAAPTRTRRPAALLPLAFGTKISSFTTDPVTAAESSARALPCLRTFEPTRGNEKFSIRSADIRAGDLTMVANSASGMVTKAAGGGGGYVFMFSLGGSCAIRDDSSAFTLRADENAILLKNEGPRETLAEGRSLFIAKLNAGRLNETIAGMSGGVAALNEDGRASLDRDFATRSLALRYGSFDFSNLFRRSFELIDSVCHDQRFLDALRLDDMIYRNIAFLLEPDLLLGAPAKTKISGDATCRATDAVCDGVRSSVGRMLTLTEMEHLSGLSRRALQYAFRKRFGVSPMTWQKTKDLRSHDKKSSKAIIVLISPRFPMISVFQSPQASLPIIDASLARDQAIRACAPASSLEFFRERLASFGSFLRKNGSP